MTISRSGRGEGEALARRLHSHAQSIEEAVKLPCPLQALHTLTDSSSPPISTQSIHQSQKENGRGSRNKGTENTTTEGDNERLNNDQ